MTPDDKDFSQNKSVYLLAAPYIIEKYIDDLLDKDKDLEPIFIVSNKGLSTRFEKTLNYLKSQGKCRLYIYKSFEINDLKLSILKILFHDLKITNVSKCYVQSLEPIVSRLIVDQLIKSNETMKIYGLLMSLPVFLFRNGEFISKKIENDELKKLVKRSVNYNKNKTRHPKKLISDLIEKVIDLIFINPPLRKDEFIISTSYVPKFFVERHYTSSEYFAFCIEQLYQEDVYVMHRKHILAPKKDKNNSLIILGPVNEKMVEDYIMDLKHLERSQIYERYIIRPHPRFINYAITLQKKITSLGMPVVICEDDILDNDILGYYSSLMDNLDSNFNYNIFISEQATLTRYPNVDINLLCGFVFGFNLNLKFLKFNGKIQEFKSCREE